MIRLGTYELQANLNNKYKGVLDSLQLQQRSLNP